jgi:hypothetical protein
MNVVICIIVGLIALLAGFALGHRRDEPTIFLGLIENINFAMGTENKTLKEENETLKKKNVFFEEWLIRSYIEQYYRKKLLAGDHQIYTIDALADLRDYAKTALDKFEENWNSKICNEQCEWTKEFLEKLIPRIDSILNDEWVNDVFDSENEEAFRRFFLGVQTNLFFDRNAKKTGRKIEKLDYWRPQEKHHESC